jgi:hypothetical protein
VTSVCVDLSWFNIRKIRQENGVGCGIITALFSCFGLRNIKIKKDIFFDMLALHGISLSIMKTSA